MQILRDDPSKGAIIEGLLEEIVVSKEQVMDVVSRGESNRHYGSTNMNAGKCEGCSAQWTSLFLDHCATHKDGIDMKACAHTLLVIPLCTIVASACLRSFVPVRLGVCRLLSLPHCFSHGTRVAHCGWYVQRRVCHGFKRKWKWYP